MKTSEMQPTPKTLPTGSGIYCLTNAVTGERYIGQAMNVAQRINSHLWGIRRGNHPIKSVRKSFRGVGIFAVQVRVLSLCDSTQLDDHEAAYIKRDKPELNSNGGRGGRKALLPAIPSACTAHEAQMVLDRLALKAAMLIAEATGFAKLWNAEPFKYQLRFSWG